MSTTDTLVVRLSAVEYRERVAAALSDIPSQERSDILSVVDEHLSDVASEGADLVGRLGTPEDYARELMESAGIAIPAGRRGSSPSPSMTQRVKGAANHHWVVGVRAFFGTLRPAWWLVRGYLIAVAVAQLQNPDSWQAWWDLAPVIPAVTGSPLDAVVVLIAMVASVMIGKRAARPAARALVIVLNIAMVAVGCYALINLNDRLSPAYGPSSYESSIDQHGLRLNGVRIKNIYPYDAAGKPLENVRLFGQDGLPIRLERHVGPGAPIRTVDEFGNAVSNVFPQVRVDRDGKLLSRWSQGAQSVPALKESKQDRQEASNRN